MYWIFSGFLSADAKLVIFCECLYISYLWSGMDSPFP